jgi:hypothetical protein
MVREHDPGVDMERSGRFGLRNSLPQDDDVLDQKLAMPIVQINREEKSAARNSVTPIIGHFPLIRPLTDQGKKPGIGMKK